MDESPKMKLGCCGGLPQVPPTGAQPCCSPPPPAEDEQRSGGAARWIVGTVDTPAGEVPVVGTDLHASDRLGAWKARWAIGRMHYSIEPGLYAVGQPTPDAPVLVSANYKMSFDRLRSQLAGIDAWIMVLDTKGINVWCAAGKGTFGTDEIVARLEATRLAEVVSHRKLVVPQLGAPGVAAHEVAKRSGFRVVYGPVRAADLPRFLTDGMQATASMRRVRFPLGDRLAVVPVELVMGAKWALLTAVFLMLLAGLGPDGYAWARVAGEGVRSAILFLVACGGGVLLTAALLPWLPGRALAVKGALVGLALAVGILGSGGSMPGGAHGWVDLAAWGLLLPAAASFVAMNFTGATTYTSLSGVRREMRLAVPLQALAAVSGVALWLIGRFV